MEAAGCDSETSLARWLQVSW